MKILIDFSFKSDALFSGYIEYITLRFEISDFEYQNHSDWIKVLDNKSVITESFDHLKINTKSNICFNFQKLKNSLPRIFINDLAIDQKEDVFFFLERSVALEEIVYGKCLESIDDVLQNNERIDSWSRKKRNIPNYISLFPNPIYTNEREKEMVSLESLPGHSHQMDYDEMLWFGSCWQMWFSPVYYKYIPKPLFDDFKDCFENKVFENGVRRITLYEDALAFNLLENRARQWAFREALGIDSIAHELTKHSNRIERENLPVLITKQNCQIGQTRVTRFLDTEGKLVKSNKASKIETIEYLNDGITIVFSELKSV